MCCIKMCIKINQEKVFERERKKRSDDNIASIAEDI